MPIGSDQAREVLVVVLCNPKTRRIEDFSRSVVDLGLPPPKLIPYLDVLDRKVHLSAEIPVGAIVRFESPGKDWQVEHRLLQLGETQAEETGCGTISRQQLASYQYELGEILAPRQWYYGWCSLLNSIDRQLQEAPAHSRMNDVRDILLMYDKPSCNAALRENSIPTPRIFGTVRSFEELQQLIESQKCRRLFLKVANGSSASGVVAYETNGRGQHKAVTTVEVQCATGPFDVPRLFNNRRLREYRKVHEIATLVDALGRHALHVEQWVPKAMIGNRVFDLRVVAIAGKCRHAVARLSRGPLTNLNLLNERRDVAALKDHIPESCWRALEESCEQVMSRVFVRSPYAGIDVLIGRDLRTHTIAEVNAFGDHLNDVFWEGLTTHQVQLLAIGATKNVATAIGAASAETRRFSALT